MAGPRRRAREVALQVLYQMDVQPELTADVALARFFAAFPDDDDEAAAPAGGDAADERAIRDHASALVRGVLKERAAVDERIGRASRNWRLERMSRVDRNLLRLAVYEMCFRADEVPGKVAINEAIEIAKRFGSSETPAFVNGVLDRVLEELAPPAR